MQGGGEVEKCLGFGKESGSGDFVPGAGAPVRAANLFGFLRGVRRREAEEEFARVEAGLVVDVHLACIVGGLARFGPPGVGEPTAGRRDEQQIARTVGAMHVARDLCCPVQHFGDAGLGSEDFPRAREVGRSGHVDMRDLVVHDREGAGGEEIGIEHFRGFARMEQPGGPEQAVGEDRAIAGDDRLDGVIAGQEPFAALRLGGGEEGFDLGEGFGECGGGLRGIGAVALQVVVQRRQVDEKMVGGVRPRENPERGFGNPAADAGAGDGTPVVEEIEFPADLRA